MGSPSVEHFWQTANSTEFVLGVLWAGLGILTVLLLVLIETGWGQRRPLRKCLALSLLAHFLLAGFATTVEIPRPSAAESVKEETEEEIVHVAFVDPEAKADEVPDTAEDPAYAASEATSEPRPWEQLADDPLPAAVSEELQREFPELDEPVERESSAAKPRIPAPTLPRDAPLPKAPSAEPEPEAIAEPREPVQPVDASPQVAVPSPAHRDAPDVAVPDRPELARRNLTNLPMPAERTTETASTIPRELLRQAPPLPRMADPVALPEVANAVPDEPEIPEDEAAPDPAPTDMAIADSSSDGIPSGSAENHDEQRLWQPSAAALARNVLREPETASPLRGTPAVALPKLPEPRRPDTPPTLPDIYSMRVAPDREELAEKLGATDDTEQAVTAALQWLAQSQAADGRWDASQYGAGRELLVMGRDRQSAGADADTGISSLALLAFLASGHTHQRGDYPQTVLQGLNFLIRTQRADGDLGGDAALYAHMYCHAMAAFALSEAYGMTGDPALRRPVEAAIRFTRSMQNPSSGGWRYEKGDPGDTSQLGWQLMALKSAELAGVPIPPTTRNGIIRFLRTVSSGTHGGLASYRPSEAVSRPMTAEALVCWQFLGMPRDNPAGSEAAEYLMGELPSAGQKPNLYYWYYGTLSMYQLQGDYWERWNMALQATLLPLQRESGPMAGSWDPDTVWGGYGGRVYSTAMATLCLEVYYRFLPLYGGKDSSGEIARQPLGTPSR